MTDECRVPTCNNPSARHRTLCHKCRSRKYKRNNPWRYYYNSHKQSARRRKIPWKLTFKQFRKIWRDSGKFEAKVNGEGWSMHRVDVNKGYEVENVEIIPVQLNVEIFWTHDRYQINFKWRERWSQRNNQPIDDCPF